MITGRSIPVAGVVGWPIAHSRSPQIHGYWLARYGLHGHYVPLGIAPDDFDAAFPALAKLGFSGVNVTIPHKERVLNHVTSRSDAVEKTGAANTIVFHQDGSVHADNTDGAGFLMNAKSCAPEWSAGAGPALVLGAGGAARAVVTALLSDGAGEILLANRTRSRAEALCGDFGPPVACIDWDRAGDRFPDAATIVNTTSLGMMDQPQLPFRFRPESSSAVVIDIVYNPLLTDFLKTARENGNKIVDGLGMLLHQAVPGFEAWFGVRPEVDAELRKAVQAEI